MTPRARLGSASAGAAIAGTLIAGLLWAPAAAAQPSAEAVDAIEESYDRFGGDTSLLGPPAGEVTEVPGGAVRDFQGGAIYYSPDTGAHVMYGAILEHYRDLGGPGPALGFPENDEADSGDGVGRFNDFSAPGGAAIYWTPQSGAALVTGRVLEAWRQVGGVSGPFGYPTADTAVIDEVQTGMFAGPEGTEIQWSRAGGLVTVPAVLAARIPGFTATAPDPEGTSSMNTPRSDTPAAAGPSSSGLSWWWIPIGIAAAALLAGVLRMVLRRRPAETATVTARTHSATTAGAPEPVGRPGPAPKPVTSVPPPKATPPRSAPPRSVTPTTPPPAAPAPASAPPNGVTRPKAATPPPKPARPAPPARPPAPKPAVNSAPKLADVAPLKPPAAAPVRPVTAEPPKATIRTEPADQATSPVVQYATPETPAAGITVTYENNAVGENQESAADKSSESKEKK